MLERRIGQLHGRRRLIPTGSETSLLRSPDRLSGVPADLTADGDRRAHGRYAGVVRTRHHQHDPLGTGGTVNECVLGFPSNVRMQFPKSPQVALASAKVLPQALPHILLGPAP